jgi:hypothetical protein
MRKTISLSLLPLLLAASGVCADFEGTIEMKMTLSGGMEGGGTTKASVGKDGVRTEMDMQMGAMGGMKMVTLAKHDNPDVIYKIDDADKTYSEMNVAKLRAMAGQGQETDKINIKKLGEETVLGYKTQHVLVTQSDTAMDMWTTKDLGDFETYQKLQSGHAGGRSGPGGEALLKALKDAGADGMPVKTIANLPGGAKATMEITKVEKKSIPASTFEIPAGYSKSSSMTDMMGGMSGQHADEMKAKMEEARKKMDDAMRNMTPEQRKMMEQMMKQHGGAAPGQ